VTVVLRQAAAGTESEKEGWWPYLQRVRAEREAAGYPFMDEAEMNAHIASLREEGEEDRIDRIYREMQQEQPKGEQP
jgi:hypothetical protein